MEKALHELTAANLRNLLIDEVKHFITTLDEAPAMELDIQKRRLRKIYELIAEKEQAELAPLQWGKSSVEVAPLITAGPAIPSPA